MIPQSMGSNVRFLVASDIEDIERRPPGGLFRVCLVQLD